MRKGLRGMLIALAAVAVVVVGLAAASLHGAHATAAASTQSSQSASGGNSSTSTAPPAPLELVGSTPASGATGVAGTTSITLQFNAPLEANAPLPSLAPAVAGSWTQPTQTSLVFEPSGGIVPDTTETVTIPGGPMGVRGGSGAQLGANVSLHWTTANGSVIRLQQLLSQLGYLPFNFTPSKPVALTMAAQSAAAYDPPKGVFTWKWSTPSTLMSMWTQGSNGVMTQGAVMAFQNNEGLPTDGVAGPQVWADLIRATISHQVNTFGYSWAEASQNIPETVTIWHDGRTVFTSLANTGISDAPTANGTFPIYARYLSTTMSGFNPDGSHYDDPGVPYVNYFNGGDAIHGFNRASYGWPQSLGCVELPIYAAAQAWNFLSMGTLVTVTD